MVKNRILDILKGLGKISLDLESHFTGQKNIFLAQAISFIVVAK